MTRIATLAERLLATLEPGLRGRRRLEELTRLLEEEEDRDGALYEFLALFEEFGTMDEWLSSLGQAVDGGLLGQNQALFLADMLMHGVELEEGTSAPTDDETTADAAPRAADPDDAGPQLETDPPDEALVALGSTRAEYARRVAGGRRQFLRIKPGDVRFGEEAAYRRVPSGMLDQRSQERGI